MNWIDEVKEKYSRHNQVLFSKKTDYLQDLSLLFSQQEHRAITLECHLWRRFWWRLPMRIEKNSGIG